MNRHVPAPEVERLVPTTLKQEVEAITGQFRQVELSQADRFLGDALSGSAKMLEPISQLEANAKVALIRALLTQLEPEHIQAIVEFGLREIGDRHHPEVLSALVNHNTRLLLKKDYSYQDRGLSHPTQYYVYLRRRKPKLDRYIGALFYIPQGCTLSYRLDAEGRIIFNSPHNVFQLQDSTNPAIVQTVRLVCLEPPPADYTFDKQQNDTPEIYLRLDYLDPKTYQSVTQESYPFPNCMYEGGKLDRYRWEVSMVLSTPLSLAEQSTQPLDANLPPLILAPTFEPSFNLAGNLSEAIIAQPTRQVLELPPKLLTFYLSNRRDSDVILKRMHLWVAWSEKAMPQSKWTVIQDGSIYTLMNARFKRRILKFSLDQAYITLEHSLPVLMKWFHELGLAVSQAQGQSQYSATQLKLARSLFVDMSLPQSDPLVFLKKLFGSKFSKTLSD